MIEIGLLLLLYIMISGGRVLASGLAHILDLVIEIKYPLEIAILNIKKPTFFRAVFASKC